MRRGARARDGDRSTRCATRGTTRRDSRCDRDDATRVDGATTRARRDARATRARGGDGEREPRARRVGDAIDAKDYPSVDVDGATTLERPRATTTRARGLTRARRGGEKTQARDGEARRGDVDGDASVRDAYADARGARTRTRRQGERGRGNERVEADGGDET